MRKNSQVVLGLYGLLQMSSVCQAAAGAAPVPPTPEPTVSAAECQRLKQMTNEVKNLFLTIGMPQEDIQAYTDQVDKVENTIPELLAKANKAKGFKPAIEKTVTKDLGDGKTARAKAIKDISATTKEILDKDFKSIKDKGTEQETFWKAYKPLLIAGRVLTDVPNKQGGPEPTTEEEQIKRANFVTVEKNLQTALDQADTINKTLQDKLTADPSTAPQEKKKKLVLFEITQVVQSLVRYINDVNNYYFKHNVDAKNVNVKPTYDLSIFEKELFKQSQKLDQESPSAPVDQPTATAPATTTTKTSEVALIYKEIEEKHTGSDTGLFDTIHTDTAHQKTVESLVDLKHKNLAKLIEQKIAESTEPKGTKPIPAWNTNLAILNTYNQTLLQTADEILSSKNANSDKAAFDKLLKKVSKLANTPVSMDEKEAEVLCNSFYKWFVGKNQEQSSLAWLFSNSFIKRVLVIFTSSNTSFKFSKSSLAPLITKNLPAPQAEAIETLLGYFDKFIAFLHIAPNLIFNINTADVNQKVKELEALNLTMVGWIKIKSLGSNDSSEAGLSYANAFINARATVLDIRTNVCPQPSKTEFTYDQYLTEHVFKQTTRLLNSLKSNYTKAIISGLLTQAEITTFTTSVKEIEEIVKAGKYTAKYFHESKNAVTTSLIDSLDMFVAVTTGTINITNYTVAMQSLVYFEENLCALNAFLDQTKLSEEAKDKLKGYKKVAEYQEILSIKKKTDVHVSQLNKQFLAFIKTIEHTIRASETLLHEVNPDTYNTPTTISLKYAYNPAPTMPENAITISNHLHITKVTESSPLIHNPLSFPNAGKKSRNMSEEEKPSGWSNAILVTLVAVVGLCMLGGFYYYKRGNKSSE
ncbi:hypothetical protein NEDG_01423 [Nematocida displodere]|uniref:Uncharacterized protein n=1 Tax=Nematocida displodere TaxID=1805483 RepID=A0A177ED83_9MICR|nr:hypothetical protein NEDG_01423 [Nematocida displodere]